MTTPSVEQIRQRLERLQKQPSAQAETAFYANADKDIAHLLTLLDTLSRELERVKGPKAHKLHCDEYHQHAAPRCCAIDCWCQTNGIVTSVY